MFTRMIVSWTMWHHATLIARSFFHVFEIARFTSIIFKSIHQLGCAGNSYDLLLHNVMCSGHIRIKLRGIMASVLMAELGLIKGISWLRCTNKFHFTCFYCIIIRTINAYRPYLFPGSFKPSAISIYQKQSCVLFLIARTDWIRELAAAAL